MQLQNNFWLEQKNRIIPERTWTHKKVSHSIWIQWFWCCYCCRLHNYSTDRLTEDAISIAMATKDNLTHQRSTFGGVTSKMNALACIHNSIIWSIACNRGQICAYGALVAVLTVQVIGNWQEVRVLGRCIQGLGVRKSIGMEWWYLNNI